MFGSCVETILNSRCFSLPATLSILCIPSQVEVPLNTALKIIKLSAGRYDTVFSVMRYVSQVAILVCVSNVHLIV